ncbi:hypothetical protein evm_013392 [Chilo suppressalis]|nr:hypothetical protein evm_013392 [Chilo suppressalis]
MQCINCGIATWRLRRHITSSLPRLLLVILAQWLSIEVTDIHLVVLGSMDDKYWHMDANICHPCFELLSSARIGGSRLLGHSMVCITCGRSVRNSQRHTVERHNSMFQMLPISHPAFHQNMNYSCHPCWMRHQRQINNDLNRVNLPGPELSPTPGLVPAPRPQPEPEIILPNYKRAANTSTHCVFNGCGFGQHLHVIPLFIKKMLIEKYNLYVARSTRVCETHLSLNIWHVLLENNNVFINFTANQIEDLINIAKSEKPILNFENVAQMQNVICHYWTGPNHMTHRDIVNRNLSIPNALFGSSSENRPAIAIFDGTYIYLQKSSNYLFQKRTYSLHKYDNLVKPFVIVSCDGHIIDVIGPFAATKTDADIMTEIFQAEDSPYRQLFQPNDVFILDRGFRDAIPLLERLGYQIHKPESLISGQTQLSSEQANKSRKVTLCRWVVEVINGRFKRDFKLFRQRFFNIASPHLMDDFKIAAALINKYHIHIEDGPNSRYIIERVEQFMEQPNRLGILVRENNLNRQRSIFSRVDGNLPQLQNSPVLEYSQLILLALGPYQVKQARSYYGGHIRTNGIYEVEVCPQLDDINNLGGSRPQLLRGRIKSRHISQRVYYVYIAFESDNTINPLDDILSYYCSCIVGNRTVGCCCHVMTIIWYLGWARHQQMLSAPASFLDSILVQLSDQ